MTQMLVDKNFKSFFKLLELKNKGKYERKVSIPKYLDKAKGRQVVEYTKQALSLTKEGYVKLSGTDIIIPTNQKDVKFVRVVPKNNNIIVIDIGYEEREKVSLEKGTAAIDIGINNLITLTSNKFSPYIINGKPLKSINQYYNKKLAELNSERDLSKDYDRNSRRIKTLTAKRNAKIDDYMHKASRDITNYLVSNKIAELVIGYNKNWKQDINLGKKNNQKFVQIPFLKLIDMLTYKCALEGIKVTLINESYTSKCSFLDDENIRKHTQYAGKRIKRGLYKTSTGELINADVNASYNILKKHLEKKVAWNLKIFRDCVEVSSVPVIKTVSS